MTTILTINIIVLDKSISSAVLMLTWSGYEAMCVYIKDQGHHTHLHYHTHCYHIIMLYITCNVNGGGLDIRQSASTAVMEAIATNRLHIALPELSHNSGHSQDQIFDNYIVARESWASSRP